MPVLANPKWERFAQGCADGLNQIDAYEAAGYPRSPSAASQLYNKEELRHRVLELIEEKSRSADQREKDDPNTPAALSFDWLVKMLMKNIDLAQKGGQISASNKAVELLAEMHNFVAKKGKKNKGDAAPDEAEESSDPTENLGNLAAVMDKLGALVPPTKDAAN